MNRSKANRKGSQAGRGGKKPAADQQEPHHVSSKPLSGKQKKELMKQQRERNKLKAQQRAREDEEEERQRLASMGIHFAPRQQPATTAVDEAPSTDSALPDFSSMAPKDLRTVFLRESDEAVEQRKRDSRVPFTAVAPGPLGYATDQGGYFTEVIDIPERPPWDRGMTKAQLESNESRYFSEYLNRIYSTYGRDRLNHFEHNLEVWRQLWRVCERSDVLLVLADVRHPLFNFPPSLFKYVTETLRKPMVLVLTKTDLVPEQLLQAWISWFKQHYPALYVVPFSCSPPTDEAPMDTQKRGSKKKQQQMKSSRVRIPRGKERLLEAIRRVVRDHYDSLAVTPEAKENFSFDSTHYLTRRDRENLEAAYRNVGNALNEETKDAGLDRHQTLNADARNIEADPQDNDKQEEHNITTCEIDEELHSEEASERSEGENARYDEDDSDGEAVEQSEDVQVTEREDVFGEPRMIQPFITLGMIGHPNAGKSSIINSLVGKKVVSVSRTPGHTKHLQTIFMNPCTRLCDCPGLVFPAVDMPLPLQILCGLINIAQVREPYTTVAFAAARMPLVRIYKLTPPDPEADDLAALRDYAWSGWTVCEAWAIKKGYLTQKGAPDRHRAGNEILRDLHEGRVVLALAPPE